MKSSVLNVLLAVSLLAGPMLAMGASKPVVWFAPNGGTPDFMDLFEKKDLWPTALARITVFKFVPPQVTKSNDPAHRAYEDLKAHDAFRKLVSWGIDIAIEVPAVKKWDCTGHGDTRDSRVRGDAKGATLSYLRNVYEAGATTRWLAIDEPLVNGLGACHETIEEVAANTATYTEEILANKSVGTWGPELAFGDVEIRGNRLDFAGDMRELRAFLQREGIPFGFLFWSGHDPEPTDLS